MQFQRIALKERHMVGCVLFHMMHFLHAMQVMRIQTDCVTAFPMQHVSFIITIHQLSEFSKKKSTTILKTNNLYIILLFVI